MTSDSITFVWDRIICIERNGEITGYTVRITGPGGDVVYENTTNMNFTATGLPNDDTIYRFSVAGFNINGTGPFRNITIRKSRKMHVSAGGLVDLFLTLKSLKGPVEK